MPGWAKHVGLGIPQIDLGQVIRQHEPHLVQDGGVNGGRLERLRNGAVHTGHQLHALRIGLARTAQDGGITRRGVAQHHNELIQAAAVLRNAQRGGLQAPITHVHGCLALGRKQTQQAVGGFGLAQQPAQAGQLAVQAEELARAFVGEHHAPAALCHHHPRLRLRLARH